MWYYLLYITILLHRFEVFVGGSNSSSLKLSNHQFYWFFIVGLVNQQTNSLIVLIYGLGLITTCLGCNRHCCKPHSSLYVRRYLTQRTWVFSNIMYSWETYCKKKCLVGWNILTISSINMYPHLFQSCTYICHTACLPNILLDQVR